jgi:hypothetical protein
MSEVGDLLAQVEEEGEPFLGERAEERLRLLLFLLAAHLLVLQGGEHLVRRSSQDVSVHKQIIFQGRAMYTAVCDRIHIGFQCWGSGGFGGIRIRMFLGLQDPDPSVRGSDPDPARIFPFSEKLFVGF